MRRGSCAVLAAALVALAAGCAAGPRDYDTSPKAAKARLLDKSLHKGWKEYEVGPGRPDPIKLALARSRRRVLPLIQHHRAAMRPGASKAPGPQPPGKEDPATPSTPDPDGAGAETPADPRQEAAISLHLRGLPLAAAVDLLAEPLDLNLMLPEDLDQPVSVSFEAITPREALEAVLARHGYELVERGAVTTVRPRHHPPGTEPRIFPLEPDSGVSVEQVKALLTPGVGTVTAGPGDRSLVVTDEGPALERVAELIKLMEQRRPQVLIEALVMEVQHEDTFEWGAISRIENVNINGAKVNAVSNLLPSPTAPFEFQVLGDAGDVEAGFSLGESTTRINVLSLPLISTKSGEEARLEVIERVPYIREETQLATEGSTQTTAFSEVDFTDVGVRLVVQPVVGADGIIEMRVEPEILELVDFFLDTPVVDERRVATTVYVRNNETLVIGGLLRESLMKTQEKIPLLGDIPLLGNLFRSDDEQASKTELLIFLTPHLMGAGSGEVDGFQAQRYLLDEKRHFPEIDEQATRRGLGR